MKKAPITRVPSIAYLVLKLILKLKNKVKPVHSKVAPRILSMVEIYDNNFGLLCEESTTYLDAMLTPPTTPMYRNMRIPIDDKSGGMISVRVGMSGNTCCCAKLPFDGISAKGTRKMFGSAPIPMSCPSNKYTEVIPNTRWINNGANKNNFVICHSTKLLFSILKSG
jgi:hypothetical protein